MNERWLKPQEVSDLDVAFPANTRDLIPPMEEIPSEFDFRKNAHNTWVDFFETWFYQGWDKTKPPLNGFELDVKPGIDGKLAMRHLGCIVRSFEPKHEHKTAAVAYLASLWFNSWKVKT